METERRTWALERAPGITSPSFRQCSSESHGEPACGKNRAMADHHHHHHDHAHGHLPAHMDAAFAVGAAINMAFVVAEVVFGLAANSVALVADAAHNLGDVLS